MIKPEQTPPNVVCDCGKGYRSTYDGKCGHCRTASERSRHWWMIHKRDAGGE